MKNKPFCIAVRETKDKIVEVLNASGLPLDAMIPILKDLVITITAQAEAEYQTELAKWKEDEATEGSN